MKPSIDPTLNRRKLRRAAPVLERYQADSATGCWEWSGQRDSAGYGRCKPGGGDARSVMAHRVFYTHHVGAIPEGLDIHHRCGNKGCVNPEHLEPLTRAENVRVLHGHTILNWEQADEIREAMDDLCEKYGVRPRTLAAIGERRIWNPETRGGDA